MLWQNSVRIPQTTSCVTRSKVEVFSLFCVDHKITFIDQLPEISLCRREGGKDGCNGTAIRPEDSRSENLALIPEGQFGSRGQFVSLHHTRLIPQWPVHYGLLTWNRPALSAEVLPAAAALCVKIHTCALAFWKVNPLHRQLLCTSARIIVLPAVVTCLRLAAHPEWILA